MKRLIVITFLVLAAIFVASNLQLTEASSPTGTSLTSASTANAAQTNSQIANLTAETFFTGTVFFDPPPEGRGAPSAPTRPFSKAPTVPAPPFQIPPVVKPAGPEAAYTFTMLDVLVVVYTDTVAGTFTNTAGLEQEVEEVRTFYWRNSHFKVLLNVDILYINEYKDLSEFREEYSNAYWLPPDDTDRDGNSVTQDLYDRNVSNDQYDAVVVYYAWSPGGPYYSAYGGGTLGVDNGFLGHTAYSAIPLEWPLGEQDWYFLHEFHHGLDTMWYYSGRPEYPHADIPQALPGDFGEHYSFNAAILRSWPVADWTLLSAPWHTPGSTLDSDGDGLPNGSAVLPVSEVALGCNPNVADTDGDGKTDTQEAMAGIFDSSNCSRSDTDSDALSDYTDPYPLYPINRQILSGTITVDGVISDTERWQLLDDQPWQIRTPKAFTSTFYASWDANFLYLGFRLKRAGIVHLDLDAQNNGWSAGRDNYEITLDPRYPDLLNARVWDASSACLCGNYGWPMWDNEAGYPFPRLVRPWDIVRSSRNEGTSGYVGELAIPANYTTGLTLKNGDVVGLRIAVNDIDDESDATSSLFETNVFADIGLVEGTNGVSDNFTHPQLAPFWTWIDPLADSRYSLTETVGSLRLITPDGEHDLFANNNAPRVLQPASGDFALQTQTTIYPLYGYQGAGLLVWQNADNYVRLERGANPDQGVHMWYRDAGSYAAAGQVVMFGTTAYLRLERRGNTFIGSSSSDGINWTAVGTATIQAEQTVRVGLDLVNQWQDNPLWADFAEFVITPTYDIVPPTAYYTNAVRINDGRPYTNDPRVTLAISATDASGVFRMQVTDGRQAWDWQSFNQKWPAVLSPGEGLKVVSVGFEDNFGNIQAPHNGVVQFDQTPPTATFSVSPTFATNQLTVTLASTATDASGVPTMLLSNNWMWEAEDPLAMHDVGYKISDPTASGGYAWKATGRIGGNMLYNIKPLYLPAGHYHIVARLKVPETWVPCPIVTLDMFDYSGGYAGNRWVTADEFRRPNEWQEITAEFDNPEDNSNLELFAYFTGLVDVWVDRIEIYRVQPYTSPATWTLYPIDGGQTVTVRYLDAAGNFAQAATPIILDRIAPASSVNGLPAVTMLPLFNVTWIGADLDPGSGVDFINIQVLSRPIGTSGGIWTDWLTHTQAVAATFRGLSGRTYCFRSQAIDRAGNIEAVHFPIDGDTCTTVPYSIFLPLVLRY